MNNPEIGIDKDFYEFLKQEAEASNLSEGLLKSKEQEIYDRFHRRLDELGFDSEDLEGGQKLLNQVFKEIPEAEGVLKKWTKMQHSLSEAHRNTD